MATTFSESVSGNNADEEACSFSSGSSEEEDMLLDIFDIDDDKPNENEISVEDEIICGETGVMQKNIGDRTLEENVAGPTPTIRNSSQLLLNCTILNNASFRETLPKSQTSSSSSSKLSPKLRAKNCRHRHHEQRWCQKNVSGAFAELRKLVPTYPVDRKLNKNEILRMTIQYIRLLVSVREWQDNNIENSSNDKMTKKDHLAFITRQSTVVGRKNNRMM